MSKFSLISLVLVASLSSTLLAQDCNNPLLSFYGLQGLDSPQSGADLPFCGNLIDADTCCSADTVASFQDRINADIYKLNNYAAARDLYLAQLRNSFFSRFTGMITDIDQDRQDQLRTIRENNGPLADELEGIVNAARQTAADAQDVNTGFVGAMDNYQNSRNACFRTALETQSSAWCLACDPNYANQGVGSDGSVVFSDDLCQWISTVCNPFFADGAAFNPLITAREQYWRLAAASRYLNDYAATGVIGDFIVEQDPYNPLETQQGVGVPPLWNSPESEGAQNDGQCEYLWAGDDQLAELLTIGVGGPTPVDENGEQPTNEEQQLVVVDTEDLVPVEDLNRLLQDASAVESVWTPDLSATGLNFDGLRKDPADFFQASDYSDYFNQGQDATDTDVTDATDN